MVNFIIKRIKTNLQILTAKENRIKKNTFKPFFEEFVFKYMGGK